VACAASQLIGVKRHRSMKPCPRDHRRQLVIATELDRDPKSEIKILSKMKGAWMQISIRLHGEEWRSVFS
jgi:hypothetical protein